jgi:tripartite-type tricarboxylate transporter receptor subunit TctC
LTGRKITIQVPIPAGGTYDLMARALIEPMSEISLAKVSVENRPALDGWLALRTISKSQDRDIQIGLLEAKKLIQLTAQKSIPWSTEWLPIYTFIRQDSVWLTRASNDRDIRSVPFISFAGSLTDQIEAKAVAKLLNKDLKLISSYNGISEFAAATLRREVDYFGPVLSTANRLMRSGDYRPALILGSALQGPYAGTPYLLGPGNVLSGQKSTSKQFTQSVYAKKLSNIAQSSRMIISSRKLDPALNECLEELVDQSFRSEKFQKKVAKFGFEIIHEGKEKSKQSLVNIQQDIIDLESYLLND